MKPKNADLVCAHRPIILYIPNACEHSQPLNPLALLFPRHPHRSARRMSASMSAKPLQLQVRPRGEKLQDSIPMGHLLTFLAGKPIKNLPEYTYALPQDNARNLYERIAAKSRFDINRLRITKGSDGSHVPNSRENTIDELGLFENSTIFVKDLGQLQSSVYRRSRSSSTHRAADSMANRLCHRIPWASSHSPPPVLRPLDLLQEPEQAVCIPTSQPLGDTVILDDHGTLFQERARDLVCAPVL